MSYKELENQIAAWAGLEQFAQQQQLDLKADKAKKKADKARRKARPPLYIPDAPVKHLLIVTLNVRKIEGCTLGDLVELEFPIGTISELDAEIKAKAMAKSEGYVWRGTVSIEPK